MNIVGSRTVLEDESHHFNVEDSLPSAFGMLRHCQATSFDVSDLALTVDRFTFRNCSRDLQST